GNGRDMAAHHFSHHVATFVEADLVLNYPSLLKGGYYPKADFDPVPVDYEDGRDDVQYFFDQAAALGQLVDVVQGMGQIYRSKAYPGAGGFWDEKRYRSVQKDMMDKSEKWLVLASSISGTSSLCGGRES